MGYMKDEGKKSAPGFFFLCSVRKSLKKDEDPKAEGMKEKMKLWNERPVEIRDRWLV